MKTLKPLLLVVALMLAMAAWAQCANCAKTDTPPKAAGGNHPTIFKASGEKNWINGDYYFVYKFDKKPKVTGTSVLVVKLYDKNKKMKQDVLMTANAYMPAMKGMHDTGDIALRLNKKGEYLVPITWVMSGKWEVELKFSKAGKQISYGCFDLNL